MDRPRLIRGLRIAVSAVFGILCVLLIVLWVRSYWTHDMVWGWFHFPGYLQVDSSCGVVKIIANAEQYEFIWQFKSFTPEVFDRHWFFKLGTNDRFTWWLDIYVPHWLLVTAFAALAVAPWIHWSNSFSLRTLLIATTLIAVVLGLVVWFGR
jgi:hypothetical protein